LPRHAVLYAHVICAIAFDTLRFDGYRCFDAAASGVISALRYVTALRTYASGYVYAIT